MTNYAQDVILNISRKRYGMAIQHIKNRTVRITQGGFAVLGEKWRDTGVLLEDSKLFYITDGEIIIKIDKREILCKSGDMVLIPAGVRHDYYLSEHGAAKKLWFHFSTEDEGGSIFRRYEMPYRIEVPSRDRDRILSLFATAVRSNGVSESYELRCFAAVCELVFYYIENSNAGIKQDKESDIGYVVRYINENLSAEHSLVSLARLACLSPNYFVRKFRRQFGMAPLKYVTMARIERAKALISGTDMQISDVMVAVGFTDAAHFSKVFKAHTGYSPRSFRKVFVSGI